MSGGGVAARGSPRAGSACRAALTAKSSTRSSRLVVTATWAARWKTVPAPAHGLRAARVASRTSAMLDSTRVAVRRAAASAGCARPRAREIVEMQHRPAAAQQPVGEIGADETGAAGDQDRRAAASSAARPRRSRLVIASARARPAPRAPRRPDRSRPAPRASSTSSASPRRSWLAADSRAPRAPARYRRSSAGCRRPGICR